MNDKELLENVIIGLKQCSDLMLHGSVESSTPNVHGTFNTALSSVICMQSDVYKDMSDRGWYPVEQVPQQKINEVKQRFSPCC